jgi:hypothetical protein
MWQPAEGTGVDDKPSRGLAGQIFFFTQSSVTPVEVEGDVRIFLFDDQGTEEQQGTALHEFDFVKGSWKAQLVGTQFGPAYQIFVPYSRKGHHQAELAVRVRLTPVNGPVIFSDMSTINLPGYDSKQADADSPVAAAEPVDKTGGQLAIGNTSATAEEGGQSDITQERLRQAYLEVLADRNKTSPSPRSGRRTRPQNSVPVDPQTESPSKTTSSVVGRLQVNSNGQSLIATQHDESP